MALIHYLVFVVLLTIASALDLSRLQAYPSAQKGFHVDKFINRYWYTQARYLPCSWSGSASFSNVVFKMEPAGQSYTTHSYWRNEGDCTDITSNTPEKSPGIFTQKDPIGDVYSGEWIIVATDYKKFAISWGCTKPAPLGGSCSDPWVSVDTVRPRPDSHTLKIIEKVLNELFGLTLAELVPASHDNPCIEHRPPPPTLGHQHLKKVY